MKIPLPGRFPFCAAASPLVLLLSACAASPPAVQSSGTLPGEGSYGFGEAGAPPTAAASLLSEHLAHHGLVASETPRYLIQTEYSRPPAKTGTLIADRTPAAWQRAPQKSGGTISHLSVSVTDVASGTEVYRTTASQRMKGKADDSAVLMQAALTPPPVQGR